MRSRFLSDYQNPGYARRFEQIVERARQAEGRCRPDSTEFTQAVARCAFTLMAYKDEYEVARLHLDPAFERTIGAQFDGDFRLRFHLAPPLLARLDQRTGRPRKHAYGPWIRVAFRLLRSMRGLRGTVFDPFGRTTDRRLERALIGDYFKLIEQLCDGLRVENHTEAVAVARWPETIRGYGPVKLAAVRDARRALETALAKWQRTVPDALDSHGHA